MRGKRFVRWLRLRPMGHADLARDLDEEIAFHIDARAEQLMRRGLSEGQARAEAMRRFGALAGARRTLHDAAVQRERRIMIRRWLEGVRDDVKYALRSIIRERGLSVVILTTMALGIGANAAMFGIIDRLLLRGPMHVRSPDELVRVYRTVQREGLGDFTGASFGYVTYLAMRNDTRSFAGVAAYAVSPQGTIGRGMDAELGTIGAATADFFPLLGVSAQVGRFFDENEDRPPQGENVVVISDGLWRRRYAGSPGVIGQTLFMRDEDFTVIGVAPAGFTGIALGTVDAWIPMTVQSRTVTSDWEHSWRAQWLRVVARLRPDATTAGAGDNATGAHRRSYTGELPWLRDARITVAPLHFNDSGREPLEVTVSRWLLGVSAVVLIIACANVTNLFLARTSRRRRELAVRLAMGISRARLIRLSMLHGTLLALGGGVLALVLARVTTPIVRSLLLPEVDWTTSPINSRVLLYTALIAVSVGVLTSLLPAVRTSRPDLTTDLKSGEREGGGRSRARAFLTIAQTTLSVVLLIGAGLFSRSLANIRGLPLGIEPERVLAVSLRWPASEMPPGLDSRARRNQAYADALEHVRAMVGVERASVAVGTPFEDSFTVDVRATGWDTIPQLGAGGPYVAAVTRDYFETVGTRRFEGRTFEPGDRAGSEPVAIINQTMARRLWPDGGALGKCLYVGSESNGPVPCSRIVGVVEDARRFSLREEPAMQYYIPFGHEREFGGPSLLIRPHIGIARAELGDRIRSEMMRLDPALSFAGVSTMQDAIDPQVRPWRLGAIMFSLFGGLALLIAAIGLYSVIAYTVAMRTREIGVRMALGARSARMLAMVLRQGAMLAVTGIVIGLVLAVAFSRYLNNVLFNASPHDPFVFAGVMISMLVVALIASLLPAWRAARVDPLTALRID